MKSPKALTTEAKIIKRIKNYPNCLKLANYLIEDEELQVMQDYANNVSIKRLGFNDHGPVHMRQVTINAIKMLQILHECNIKTSLEKEEMGTFEDSLCALILAGFMHDLGMMISRASHEKMSVVLAKPIMERALKYVFPDNLAKRTIITALALESIVGHMSTQKVHSLEAGIILIADGCDMTKGRARIPLAIKSEAKVGDIHIYSANAITSVKISRGEVKPIKITVDMSQEVGLFQIEEVLLTKVEASTAKEYIELFAGVNGEGVRKYK